MNQENACRLASCASVVQAFGSALSRCPMSRTLAVILVATMVARSTAPAAAGDRDSTTSEVQSAPAQVALTPPCGQAPGGSQSIVAGLEVRAAHPEGETRKLDLKNGKPMTEGRPAALTTLYVSFG